MNVLGIVPARGGSRAIPRKNLAPVGGRPLLAWTADAAAASAHLSRCILSTDDPEIASMGEQFGLEVPFLRPPELATSTAGMLDVMRHAVEAVSSAGWSPDVVVLLQPTSPLRTAEHIDGAIDRFLAGAGCVVSVVEVPHQFRPASVLRREGDRLIPYEPAAGPVVRRQDKPVVYARNGPAVLVVPAGALQRGELYPDPVVPFVMSAAESPDVDEPADLLLVDWLLRRREDDA